MDEKLEVLRSMAESYRRKAIEVSSLYELQVDASTLYDEYMHKYTNYIHAYDFLKGRLDVTKL